MRWMMYRWWCEGGGDRAWWVIESVFLRLPDKGFWACLGDIPPDMPRRPETWVSLYNLMMKLFGISRSSAILGSDSPQSNNRKDHSLWGQKVLLLAIIPVPLAIFKRVKILKFVNIGLFFFKSDWLEIYFTFTGDGKTRPSQMWKQHAASNNLLIYWKLIVRETSHIIKVRGK